MVTEVEVAVISLAGVLLSGFISNIVARRISKEQLRVQTDREFSFVLFNKRVEVYGELFTILSDFIKLMKFGRISSDCKLERVVSKRDIMLFLGEIEKWDSKNTIFMTQHTSKICYKLRKDFHELVKKSDEDITTEFAIEDNREIWRQKAAGLEASIKNEIGISAIKPFPTNTDFKPVFTYTDLENNACR